MTIRKYNLFSGIPAKSEEELFEDLIQKNEFLLERIVSYGQATPDGEWLAQERSEWVILLRGQARLSFENSSDLIEMMPGDYLLIPAFTRHRVEWTDPAQKTIWLALHYWGD